MKKDKHTALQENAGLEPASLDFSRSADDTLEVRFSGTWRIGQTIPPVDDLEKQLNSEPGVEKIAFDTVALNGWDSGLLMHSQVTTFFHEFGHLLHHLFAGRGRFLRFSGINTEWDFVEVPSQLYEEWAWDPDVLATFAKHHQTGEVIPTELVQKLREAEEYGKALGVVRQMTFARLSLACYEGDPQGLDPELKVRELKRARRPARTASVSK